MRTASQEQNLRLGARHKPQALPLYDAPPSRTSTGNWKGDVVTATPEDWVLDELANAGRENLDEAHVARYDDKEDADAADEVELLQQRGLLDHSSTVVDLGAGTGQFALAAAGRCARMVAVDVSPVMLRRLRTNVDASKASNVEIVAAGYLTYEHDGAPADVVYSRYALHHLPDFWKAVALSRIHDLLRPGGALRLWDAVYHFEPAQARLRLEAWMAQAAPGGVHAGWNRAELAEHIRDENSTFTWLLEPMLERVGFRIAEATYDDSGVFARYICIRP